MQLTEEGSVFYDSCLRVLSDLEEAERSVLADQKPTGHLRVTTNIPIGRHFLLPILPEFLNNNPAITLDTTLTDKVINLLEEYTDVAIRSGPMKDSTLIARKLGETRKIIVGAPSYLKRNGVPKAPKDLKHHNLLRFNFARIEEDWPFLKVAHKTRIKPQGNIQVSDGESMRQLALSGLGLARLARFQVQADINAGRLVPILEDYNPGDMETLHAVFLGQGGYLPNRIRAFLDFLVARIKVLA